jgi:hypothetical protein
MATIPIDPEEREERDRDPALYDAMERLHDSYEPLVEALHDRLNETGLLLRGVRGPELLEAARGRLIAAKAQWTAALADADALLYRRRQEGGE